MTNTTTTTVADDDFETPPPPEQLDTIEWKPLKVGDKLVGTLRRTTEVDTKFGRKTVTDWVDVIECVSDGEKVDVPDGYGVTYWPTPGGTQALDAKRIRTGDKGGIRLNELKDTGKGNPAKIFGSVHLGPADPFTASQTADDDQSPF